MNTRNMSAKFLVVILLLGMLLSLFAGCAVSNNEPALSSDEKAALDAEYRRLRYVYGDIIWYDEDPTIDFSGRFHRYCGTYGDAAVILISSPLVLEDPPLQLIMSLPVNTRPGGFKPSEETNVPDSYELEVHGRTIICPARFELSVFNPNHDVTPEDYSLENAAVRPFELSYVEEWMTSEQMDQALDDLEKWIAEIK